MRCVPQATHDPITNHTEILTFRSHFSAWLPTDRATLEVKGVPHVYAVGDATDLPVSKSGSAAHFEAKVVAHRLMAEIRDEATYDGEVMCFLETGQNKATQLVLNY